MFPTTPPQNDTLVSLREPHAGDTLLTDRASGTTNLTSHNWDRVMSNEITAQSNPDQPAVYQIRVAGHLTHHWTDWFGGLAITLEDNGDTLITGPVADQAALHGLLKKVRNLGIPLLSVVCIEPGQTDGSGVK
jgi:hypothetical protein